MNGWVHDYQVPVQAHFYRLYTMSSTLEVYSNNYITVIRSMLQSYKLIRSGQGAVWPVDEERTLLPVAVVLVECTGMMSAFRELLVL
jgi:hypothetical protein